MKYIKKSLLLVFLPVFFLNQAKGQIQLEAIDVCALGSYKMMKDNSAGLGPGASGMDMIWNFSDLKASAETMIKYAAFNGNGNGNTANVVTVIDNDTFDFFKLSDSIIYSIEPLQDFGVISYKDLNIFKFPMAYGDSSIDSFQFKAVHSGQELGMPSYDSVRLSLSKTRYTMIDSWGRIIIPSFTDKTLRAKFITTTMLRVEGKTGSDPYEILHDFDAEETHVDYFWYSMGKGIFVAHYDSTINEMQYLVSPKTGIKNTVAHESDLIFINPISHAWQLNNKGNNGYQLIVYDVKGKLVLKEELGARSEKSVDASALFPGYYFVEAIDMSSGNKIYKKLYKE